MTAAAAGLRQLRRARSTGLPVGVYDGQEAGLDTDGGRWQTICEDHGWIISHETLAVALSWSSSPHEWCEVCMAAAQRVSLRLHVENVYLDGTVEHPVSVTVPGPPPYDRYDWALEHLFPHTGTGRTDADAVYYVTVEASSRPDLIEPGARFAFE